MVGDLRSGSFAPRATSLSVARTGGDEGFSLRGRPGMACARRKVMGLLYEARAERSCEYSNRRRDAQDHCAPTAAAEATAGDTRDAQREPDSQFRQC